MRHFPALRPSPAALACRVRAAVHGVTRVLHAVIGAPDHARYLEHMRTRHPGAPTLGRDAFERERLRARYERPGSRCC